MHRNVSETMFGAMDGMTPDIARSGDGLTPETAVHVVAVNEAYSWLAVKQLRVTGQTLIRKGDRRYDEMAATDASGQSRHDYFDVTPFFERYLPMANQPWRPPVARRPLTIRRVCASIAVDVTVAG
ncbi:hypothetical protein WJ23_29125 [Burkholderia lata]|nr:hypothetical protein WJ23_29125 [Burkholderia lata]